MPEVAQKTNKEKTIRIKKTIIHVTPVHNRITVKVS